MARTPKPWFYRQTGWWMVWLGGKKVKLAKGKKNKKQAELRFLELRQQMLANPRRDDPNQTVASVIDAYLDAVIEQEELAESTLSVRKPYLQSFAEFCGWKLVTECTDQEMKRWVKHHPGWRSAWTKNSAVRNVQVAFNWATKTRLIKENPFRGFSQPAGAPRRDVTDQEFQALLRATAVPVPWKKPTPGARFRQVLIFLRYTGCRPHEAAHLKWSDVDFDRQLITLKQHKTIRTQRQPRPRVIPLDSVVVRLLEFIRDRGEHGSYVFVNHRRTAWNKHTLSQRLYRARKAAGLSDDATLYGIRHAFGTRGILRGCDIKSLSTLMGHTTTRMSEHYVHLSDKHDHLAAAMRTVNGRRLNG